MRIVRCAADATSWAHAKRCYRRSLVLARMYGRANERGISYFNVGQARRYDPTLAHRRNNKLHSAGLHGGAGRQHGVPRARAGTPEEGGAGSARAAVRGRKGVRSCGSNMLTTGCTFAVALVRHLSWLWLGLFYTRYMCWTPLGRCWSPTCGSPPRGIQARALDELSLCESYIAASAADRGVRDECVHAPMCSFIVRLTCVYTVPHSENNWNMRRPSAHRYAFPFCSARDTYAYAHLARTNMHFPDAAPFGYLRIPNTRAGTVACPACTARRRPSRALALPFGYRSAPAPARSCARAAAAAAAGARRRRMRSAAGGCPLCQRAAG